MRHKVKLEIVFDSDLIGFGECDGMTDIELLRMLAREEGFFSIIDVSNDEIAEGIISVEPVSM